VSRVLGPRPARVKRIWTAPARRPAVDRSAVERRTPG